MELFEPQTSLDKFLSSALFVIGILSTSSACGTASQIDAAYKAALVKEFAEIGNKLAASGLTKASA